MRKTLAMAIACGSAAALPLLTAGSASAETSQVPCPTAGVTIYALHGINEVNTCFAGVGPIVPNPAITGAYAASSKVNRFYITWIAANGSTTSSPQINPGQNYMIPDGGTVTYVVILQ